jgi:uncharacterized membrane protein
MQKIFLVILIIHIAAGTTALISGLLAIIFRNKVKVHKPIGRVYFWAMTVIFISAVYMSIVHSNIFLFCVSFFTYYSCLIAYRSLRLKKLHLDQKPARLDWAIEVFFGLMHIGFILFATYLLTGPNVSFGIISMVFGLIGINGNYGTIKRFRKKLIYKNYWLLAHIGGMLGSYIGAITAFVVNNSRHIPAPNLLLWLGPAALIVPLIIIELKKHKEKAGKFAIA